jgi:hypothetical protein
MTSSMVRLNGAGPMQGRQQPAALQMVQIEPTTASQLESVTSTAILAFHGAADGASIMAALDMAAAVNDLRTLFDRPEIKARIVALQDTPLGFRTDQDPKVKRRKKNQITGQFEEKSNTPYSYDIVREAAIEALLRRLQLVGNQFNVIAGRFYCTKEGFEALIRQLPAVANFRPVIGVPQSKPGGVIVDCSATWTQNGETQSLKASIPVKTDDYSGADQSIGKATRKFLKRCYECMTGNSIPEGDTGDIEGVAAVDFMPATGIAISLPASAKTPPEIAAAAAPVATLTQPQQAAIQTALDRQLTPVGRAAFVVDACDTFGVRTLDAIPAEHHTALMQSFGSAVNRDRWDRGCGHADGNPILTAEQIAELTQAPEAAGDAPQQQPAAAPQRAASPAPKAAALAAPEPVEQAAADQGEPGDDSDAVQAQLM